MSTKTKKTLTRVASITTSAATILWLSGISMLAPAMAATYANGTLLKGSTGDVWVVNNNLKSPVRSIEVFNNSGYDWTKVKAVSNSALNAVPTATLIKTANNPDVYRLEKNFIRKLASIEIFNSYSLDWNKISVVSQPVMDSFSYAPIYQHGVDLFWRDANNVLHRFPNMDLFTGNGYNTRDLITVNDMEYGSFGIGGAITSAPTTPVTETPATGTLSVALSADTPAAATLASDNSLPSSYYGFGVADLAHFTFTNGSGADIKVTQVKVKRLGISGDSTITDLYLFDGYTRLTDEATFSSGVATFNDASGIFTVPAHSSKTIAVRGDYYSTASISGQTIGVSINAATDIVSNAASVSGSFPMNGNLMSITESGDLGTAALSSVTSPSSSVDAQADFTAWTNTLTVATQDLNLEMIRFTQVGSISVGDFTNIRLRINNVDVATGALVTGKTGQDLVFDLRSNPYKILKGTSKNITVVGDIVGGTSRTLRLGIDKPADIMLKDLGYGNYTMVTGTFPSRVTATTISVGTITMTKRTDSPSGNLTVGATNQSLAKFDVKANGEEIKINTLKVQAYMSATTSTTTYLKNVSLYLDGVQVGNTTNVKVTAGASDVANYTSFNIYQKIPAATTKTLEVKADVYTCAAAACSTNIASANDKIEIKILGSASEDNAQGMTSLDATIDAPGSTATANEMTLGTGSLSLYKNTAYSDQTVSSGGLIKMGSYNLQANAYDTVNITGFTVAYVNQVGTIATSKWSNMYLVYGGTTSSVKGTISTSNTFSVNTSLAANASMQIDVYATLDASVTSGAASTTLAVTATKATDGSDASASAQVGQNVTVATASRSVAIDTVIPSALVVGGTQDVEMMDVRFKSLSAPSTIDQMRLKYVTTGDSNVNALVNCKLNYPTETGTAETAYLPFVYASADTYYATFTGMTMYLPANLDKTVKVYCNFNYVGTGYADTGDYPAVNLYDYRVTSGGTQTTETWSNITSQFMVLRKSKPVFTANTLPSTYLAAGTGITIAKFTITPDAAGAIGWNRLVFQYASSTNPTLTSGATTIKLYNENTGVEVTASSTINTPVDFVNKDITFVSATEQVVGSATTYTLRADIGGTMATGDYLSVYIKNGNSADTTPTIETSYAGRDADDSIVWTDRSNNSHTLATSDWTNDWLVKTIGSGYGWTMTR